MNRPADFSSAASAIISASNKVHVLLRKEDFDATRLSAKVVIVLDILFATTTIVAALAHGANEVIPATDEHDARNAAKQFSDDNTMLAGEKHIHPIPGFESPMPLALVQKGVAGKRLIYSTTNGTVALKLASVAPHVYAACLLNGAATVDHVLRAHPGESVLVVCSGSAGGMNLEDYYGAGYIVDRLAGGFDAGQHFTDAALSAQRLYRTHDAFDSLISSRVGRIMERSGLTDEVRYAAQPGLLPQVAKLIDGSVKVING